MSNFAIPVERDIEGESGNRVKKKRYKYTRYMPEPTGRMHKYL